MVSYSMLGLGCFVTLFNPIWHRLYGLILVALVLSGCGQVPDKPTRLMVATQKEEVLIVERLLLGGAQPNQAVGLHIGFSLRFEGSPMYGQTALMYAVESNNPNTVQILLEAGGDPAIADSAKRSSWNRACRNFLRPGSISVLRELLERADLPSRDACSCLTSYGINLEAFRLLWPFYNGEMCFSQGLPLNEEVLFRQAIAANKLEVVKYLEVLKMTPPKGMVALAADAWLGNGDSTLIRYLLEQGYDPDEPTVRGITAMDLLNESYVSDAASNSQVYDLIERY